MKPQKLILFLLVVFNGSMFAQSANTSQTIVCSNVLLQQISSVKTLGDNVNAAYQNNLAATTLSRSGATAVKNSLDQSYVAYLAELQNQLNLNSTDSPLHSALVNEIALVKKLQSGK